MLDLNYVVVKCSTSRFKKKKFLKDPLYREEQANKTKNYRKNTILKLTRKINHFNKYFYYNKLNIFKIWEGIREIINIS